MHPRRSPEPPRHAAAAWSAASETRSAAGPRRGTAGFDGLKRRKIIADVTVTTQIVIIVVEKGALQSLRSGFGFWVQG